MPTLWDADARGRILARIEKVNDSSKPLWGKFTADRMLCHLAEAMKMTNGEITLARMRVPVRYFPLKQLAIYVMPFPKGLPTSPGLLAAPEMPVDDARADLRSAIERFGMRDPNGAMPEHPAFGALTSRAWGVLAYRHCDHHLRQFGV